MRAAQVLGLWLSDGASPATRMEAWRTLVAALAGGMRVRLLDLRPAPPAPPGVLHLGDPHLGDPELRLLDALAAGGAPLERAPPEELAVALREAASIVAVAPPDRTGTPQILTVDAAFLAGAPVTFAERLCAAGQIMSGGSAAPSHAP